jgi:hypothetical protein
LAYHVPMLRRPLSPSPRPRLRARTPVYPSLPAAGLALALASCQPSPVMHRPPAPPDRPVATAGPSDPPVMVMAVDPSHPAPPRPLPPQPLPLAAMERIEDPSAQRVPVACPGDCPSSFQTVGPKADLAWRVESGSLPNARAVLVSVQPKVRACLLAWNRTGRGMSANITMRATVGIDGNLHGMSVQVDGEADSDLTTCVANRVQDTRFASVRSPCAIVIVAELSRP